MDKNIGKIIDSKLRQNLKIKKDCSCCGKKHSSLPEETIEYGNMYWFNYSCQSTLCVKVKG